MLSQPNSPPPPHSLDDQMHVDEDESLPEDTKILAEEEALPNDTEILAEERLFQMIPKSLLKNHLPLSPFLTSKHFHKHNLLDIPSAKKVSYQLLF